MERPSLHALTLFLATVERGTLTAAAKTEAISQPAISMHLRALDRLYGTALMERSGRRVKPTAAGRLVAEYTRRILELVDDLGRAIGDVKELRAGQLLVGASATVGETLLPQVLGRFRRAYPGIEVALQIGNSKMVLQGLRDRTLGMGIVGTGPGAADLEAMPVLADQIEIFVASDSPLLRRAPVHLADLGRETFVLREAGSATRDVVLSSLAARRFTPAATVEFGSNEAVKRAVAAGLGIGVLSTHTLGVDVRAGDIAILRCVDWDCRRQFWLVQRRGRRLSRVEEAFVQVLRASRTRGKPGRQHVAAGARRE